MKVGDLVRAKYKSSTLYGQLGVVESVHKNMVRVKLIGSGETLYWYRENLEIADV